MARRAQEVVTILSYIRRLARDGTAGSLPSPAPEDLSFNLPTGGVGGASSAVSSRGPKRPWGEVAGDEDDEAFSPQGRKHSSYTHGPSHSQGGEERWDDDGFGGPGADIGKSAAEKDMALIRRKRATHQAPQNVPKGKYRKRSVSSCFLFY